MRSNSDVVPLAGIEPALLAESDFESDASTSSATGASAGADGWPTRRFGYHGGNRPVNGLTPNFPGMDIRAGSA